MQFFQVWKPKRLKDENNPPQKKRIRHFRRKNFHRMHFRRRNIGRMEHWSNGTLVERNIGRTNIRLTEHSSNSNLT